ncbi:glycoside hydrolase family 6 protein [Allokutzneria multivorans]|uniref:Glucanase n=1 Tax=Allokutzneria multivorans TaxID=1142134 RepID=A0ABP7RUZ1_9PSEU
MKKMIAAALVVAGMALGAGPATANADAFYVDPTSNPAKWLKANGGDPRAAKIKSAIVDKPMAKWFGNWNANIGADVSAYVRAALTAKRMPVLVAYNITGRDCGSHSGGGAGSPAAYRTWSSAFASAIGTLPAVVVIEPDAVAQLDCLAAPQKQVRLDLLKHVTAELKAKAPNAFTYLDGGNSSWIAAPEMAKRLTSAGIANTRGFAVNVSNYRTTAESARYGSDVVSHLGQKKSFVIDVSRNGNGSNGQWCNPAGRKLGEAPRLGAAPAEMLLWVKVPGDSDGKCGIAPNTPAGAFTPEIAMRLINGI